MSRYRRVRDRSRWYSNGTDGTLLRFAFRLAVVMALAISWPEAAVSPAHAASMLCAAMAIACVFYAMWSREVVIGAGLNHWHESVALSGLAILFGGFM